MASGRAELPIEQSFLDRMMTLTTAEKDQTYRQSLSERIILESQRAGTLQREAALYQDLVSNIRDVGPRDRGGQQTATLISARTKEAFDEVSKALKQLSDLHHELALRNLNPSATLYAVTGPFIFRVARPLTIRAISLYFLVVLALALIIASLAALIHNAFRGESRIPAATGS